MSQSAELIESVILMVHAKVHLDFLSPNYQNPEYSKILDLVNQYLQKYCQHRIVTDTIDIDLDHSKTIHYCELCEQTFDEIDANEIDANEIDSKVSMNYQNNTYLPISADLPVAFPPRLINKSF